MISYWQNHFGFFFLAIILHIKCNLGQSIQKSLCSDGRLYFEGTKKCYDGKWKGPCGEQMVLEKSAEDSIIGVCKCDIPQKNLHLCPIRPTVFLQQYSRCFSLFDQGPCEEGEWLVPTGNKNGNTKCEVIPCPKRYRRQYKNERRKNGARDNNKFVFAHNGKCYETLTKDEGNLCEEDEMFLFVGMEQIFYRKCTTGPVCAFTSPPKTNCTNGAKADMHGGCESNAEFL